MSEESTIFGLNINENYEAFLDYNGEPEQSDDPADYYISLKGVRIA